MAACQNQAEKNEIESRVITSDAHQDTLTQKSAEKDSTMTAASVEIPIYIAQCSEPFMAAYFFEHKIRLIFPEKTDSVLNIKNPIDWNIDFEGNFNTVNNLNVKLSVSNKACVHPGSGEIWEKKVTFVINQVEYKGCIRKLNEK